MNSKQNAKFSLFSFLYREFMHCIAPPMVRAKSAYMAEGRLTIDHGDILALIDERPDLRFIKGQNQRTFDIGTFPRYGKRKLFV